MIRSTVITLVRWESVLNTTWLKIVRLALAKYSHFFFFWSNVKQLSFVEFDFRKSHSLASPVKAGPCVPFPLAVDPFSSLYVDCPCTTGHDTNM